MNLQKNKGNIKRLQVKKVVHSNQKLTSLIRYITLD